MNMNLFDIEKLGQPRRSKPAPERVIEGNPEFTTWNVETTDDGKTVSGIWEATPGSWQSSKDGTWEFCTILAGVSELIEAGEEPRLVKTGDTFVLRPDFRGVWRVIETTRKAFVTQSA